MLIMAPHGDTGRLAADQYQTAIGGRGVALCRTIGQFAACGAGNDLASALTGIDRLHVLCPLPTPEAESAAAALARAGGGISQPVRRLAEVAPALTRALSLPA